MLSRWGGRVGSAHCPRSGRLGCQRRAIGAINAGNPWVMAGGCTKHLAAELDMGLYEENLREDAIWGMSGVQDQARKLGSSIEEYGKSTLASKERIILWERFRLDLQTIIRNTMNDKDIQLLMMGGVAQGMATYSGDVDLIIYLPNHLEAVQDRNRVKNIFHNICRGLKRQGFDGFVIPARVPIIQYRPDPAIGKLFNNAGADALFRFLKVTESASQPDLPDRVQKVLNQNIKELQVQGVGRVFEFPLAADAYSAMIRFPRTFELLHYDPHPDTSRKLKAEQVLELREKMNDPEARKGLPQSESRDEEAPNTVESKEGVTIDDILRIASKGRTSGKGPFVPYPFAVDVSIAVNQAPWGPRNSELLRRYCSDPRIRCLAMFVKWWSKNSLPVQINASRSGWLTSYCVLVLFIHFMIRTKKLDFIDPEAIKPITKPETVYPKVRKLRDEDKVEMVRDLYNFFWYYATEFDPSTEVVTLLTPHKKLRDQCSAKVMSAKNISIIIEDPYEDRSLGHAINADQLVCIRSAFLAAARSLRQSLTGHDNKKTLLLALKNNGRDIFDKYFPDFPKQEKNAILKGPNSICRICRVEPHSNDNGLCKPCNDGFEAATIPLTFFAKRTGLSRQVTAQIHISEQRKQERAIRDQQFLQRNNKGSRKYRTHSM
eukprot:TRINITY_DN11888_c3_g1_i2.p1 TRINITY_DN11888_c3_g1~~TRINITY_DN11888_c3_g1_i2.p1  ORF type:complete len:660 (+),score=90.34 TRINITY_DN11888_c3_g1_i2:91-2070(+)